jgi:hypothetical protein
VSDMHDALNELAQRGEPRGFDHVLAAAAAAAERGTDHGDEENEGADDVTTGDLDPIPFVTTEPVARPRRRPFGSMVAAAGVAALVLVGAFAVSAVVGGGGGSSSAEGAVRRLADALSHEDPLAAADVLAPDEVRSLHGTLDDAAKKAQELQLVQTAGAPLAGVDFNVDGLKLSTESLGDGYAKVTVDAGTFTASTQKAKFSALMQKVLRNTDDNSAQSDLAKLFADKNLPTFLVVVRRDGNWYVSAAYTVLEYVREEQQLPAADFGSGERNISTLGADSPDAAVQDSMRALQRNDWSKLMTMVSPSEIPVYDYRDAITALIHKRDDGQSAGPSTNFTIDSMTTNAQVDGDTAKVTLKASGTTDSGKWSLDGGCFTPPGGGTPAITCGGGGMLGLLATPYSSLSPSSQFTVVKQDGRWFVSPVGTVLDVVDQWIKQLDRRTLYNLLGVPNQLPPDGSLTLGKPVVLNAANQYVQILSFDGHKGEKLLGLGSSANSPVSALGSDSAATTVRAFAPDGSEMYEAPGLLSGQPLILPADGKDTFVLTAYAFAGGGDATITVWDAADAPAKAKQNNGETCTYGRNSTSCSSTPSTYAGATGFGPNGEVYGPDGTPMLGRDGKPIIDPRFKAAQSGQNGGGSISVGIGGPDTAPPAPTIAVPTIPTPVTPPSTSGGGSISSSETSSVPHG